MSRAHQFQRIADALRVIAEAVDQLSEGMPEEAEDDPRVPEPSPKSGETPVAPDGAHPTALVPPQTPGIAAFLEANGVGLVQERPAPDMGLLAVADFIAQKYRTVERLMLKLKRSLNDGRWAFLDLSREPKKTIADITMAATMMYRAGILEQYRYDKAPAYRLQCAPGRSPIAVAFITGSWLEMHVLGVLRGVVRHLGLRDRTDIGLGCQIRLPNGDHFELDICCLVDRKRLLWVEAKTGDNFNALLGKYARYRKALKVASTDAILCCPDFDTDQAARARAAVAEMVAAGISDLRPLFTERLRGS